GDPATSESAGRRVSAPLLSGRGTSSLPGSEVSTVGGDVVGQGATQVRAIRHRPTFGSASSGRSLLCQRARRAGSYGGPNDRSRPRKRRSSGADATMKPLTGRSRPVNGRG